MREGMKRILRRTTILGTFRGWRAWPSIRPDSPSSCQLEVVFDLAPRLLLKRDPGEEPS